MKATNDRTIFNHPKERKNERTCIHVRYWREEMKKKNTSRYSGHILQDSCFISFGCQLEYIFRCKKKDQKFGLNRFLRLPNHKNQFESDLSSVFYMGPCVRKITSNLWYSHHHSHFSPFDVRKININVFKRNRWTWFVKESVYTEYTPTNPLRTKFI
jgi:hypothetical protein